MCSGKQRALFPKLTASQQKKKKTKRLEKHHTYTHSAVSVFMLVYGAQHPRNVCVPDKHTHMLTRTLSQSAFKASGMCGSPLRRQEWVESLVNEEDVASAEPYIKEQHQISARRNLETAHALHSLSSGSLEALSGCDGRLEGQHLEESRTAECLKKHFSCSLISVYRHLFSHSLRLLMRVEQMLSTCAACR